MAVHGFYAAKYSLSAAKKVVIATSLVLIILASTLLQSLFPLVSDKQYELTPEMYSLVGDSRDDTADYLKLNDQGSSYDFVVPETTQAGESEHTGRVADAFSASLSTDPDGGITVTDKQTNIAVGLIPQFPAREAKKIDGDHIVYASGSNKLVYTLKYNGLKEDIIIPHFKGSELSYKFDLVLPSGVEARLLDKGNGLKDIGIYSSDPTLYGNISFGSDEDRARVDKARENGDKTNLVMTIPYPVVKDATGTEYSDRAVFVLGDKTTRQTEELNQNQQLPAEVREQLKTKTIQNVYSLSIETKQLQDLTYPISVDPTIRIDSAGDFGDVNVESGATIDTTNSLIKRASLTGGVLNSWQNATATTTNTGITFGATVIGDYLVVMQSTGYDYINIATDPNLSGSFTWVAHASGSASTRKPIYYNKHWYWLDPDGVKYSTNNFVIGQGVSISGLIDDQMDERQGAAFAIHNNRMYVSGGCVDDGFLGNAGCGDNSGKRFVSMIPINADGSITPGTWTHWNGVSDPRMATRRSVHAMIIVDSYMYIAGGCTEGTGSGYSCNGSGSSVNHNTVEYTKINDNGTLAGFVTAASTLPWDANSSTLFSYAGYMYMYRADNTSGTNTGAVAYAQINADKSLGTWRATASLNLARSYLSSTAVHNNRVYTFGGCFAVSPCNNTNTIEYANIKPAGTLAKLTWDTGSTLNTAINLPSTAVSNGYIYRVGGATSATGTASTTVEYAPLNADGSIGGWTNTSSMTTARAGAGVVVDRGYIYVMGGCTFFSLTLCTNTQSSTEAATIASNGAINNDWAPKTTMIRARMYISSAVVYNGRIYMPPSCNGAGNCFSTVERADITAPGTLSSWTEDGTGTALPASYAYGGLVTWSDKLFWITGDDNVLRYSTIDPVTGSVAGTWSSYGQTYTARRSAGIALHNGVIYILGGVDGSNNAMTTVESLALDSTGVPTGSWRTETSLYTATAHSPFIASAGFLYGLKISPHTTTSTATAYIPINNGGSGFAPVANWTLDNTGGFEASHSHASVAYEGYIFVIGGCGVDNCSPVLQRTNRDSKIMYAPVNNDGSLGSWTYATGLPYKAQGPVATIYNGRLYVGGGDDDATSGSTSRADMYYSDINLAQCAAASASCLGSMQSVTNLPTNNNRGQVFAHAGYMYVIGATATRDQTYYTAINSNGTLGGLWTPSSTLPAGRTGTVVSVAGDRVYVMSGRDTGGNPTRDIYTATITPGSGFSAWQTLATKTPYSTTGATDSVGPQAVNGYLYFYGNWCDGCSGWDGLTAFYAPILPSGELGQWQTGSKYTQTHGLEGQVYYRGFLYGLGGKDGSGGVRGSSQYVRVGSIPRVGSFSKRYDFNTGVRPTKLITRGTKQTGSTTSLSYMNNNNTGATWGTATSLSDIGYFGTNALSIALGTNVTLSRYLWLRYTVDETQSAVFPDAGNESYITDFDLYYTSNPGKRLRGGQTFTNGIDRGLNATPQ